MCEANYDMHVAQIQLLAFERGWMPIDVSGLWLAIKPYRQYLLKNIGARDDWHHGETNYGVPSRQGLPWHWEQILASITYFMWALSFPSGWMMTGGLPSRRRGTITHEVFEAIRDNKVPH